VYKKFFGLAKDPFIVSPDPSFLFSTPATEKTYASLLYGIQARKGLILLVGEVGTGKTLLLRKLMEQLHDAAAATAFVFNPRMKAADFLDYVLGDFGVEYDPSDRLLTFKILQDWLLKRNKLGQASVLIVDEAQNLSPEAFQVVHALSNLETPTDKLLQIILSGQREIEGILRLPEMKPLSQRIAVRLRTGPLSPAETLQYIAHRLRVAGGDIKTVFTPGAIKAVSWSSAGIPRLINLICEHALISGYADQRRPVGAETVQVVAREFSLAVANLSPEDLAEGVPVPLAAGALTPPIKVIPPPKKEQGSERISAKPLPATPPTEVRKSLRPPTPAAAPSPTAMPGVTVTPPGAGVQEFAGAQSTGGPTPMESPSGPPMIALMSPAGAQGVAEDTSVASRKTPQPLLLKRVAGGRGFAPINNNSSQPAGERTGAPRWAALVLVTMGLVLGGYYLFASGFLTKLGRGEPPHARIQSPISGKSTTDNPAGTQAPSPSVGTVVTGQEQAPTQPATSVPAGKPGEVTATPANSAREVPPSFSPPITPRSSEREGLPKPATHGTPAPLPPAQGQIAVTSNLLGATITVDGRSDPDWTTPHIIKELSPGVHRMVVSKEGFHEAHQSVTVVAGRATSINITLTPPRGEIDISTSPPGAEVLIDGKSYGPGPIRAEVDAGQHAFLVRQAGRQPVEGKLAVQDQSVVQRTIDLPLKPSPTPELNIAVITNPPAAKVYADGAPKSGNTPISFHLSPGHHILIITAAGFRPVRREIDVPEDGVLTVNAALSAQ
jgi:type II secretory pathway predicted ATPase ExeA